MKTHAIILKKQNTHEFDQFVTCYTQELGKITAVAKSILKKSSIQSMHLDLFNLVSFELVIGNGFPIVTGAEAEKTYLNLKSSVKALSTAFVIGEYIDKLVFEYSKDDRLWNFLSSKLDQLDKINCDMPRLLKASQKEILGILGYPVVADLGLHTALENIAGQSLKAISFFNLTNSSPNLY